MAKGAERYRSAAALHAATLQWAADRTQEWEAKCEEWRDLLGGSEASYGEALVVNKAAAASLEALRSNPLAYPVVDCEDIEAVLLRLHAQRQWLEMMAPSRTGRPVAGLAMLVAELQRHGATIEEMTAAAIGAGLTSPDDYRDVARRAVGATLANGLEVIKKRIRSNIRNLQSQKSRLKNP